MFDNLDQLTSGISVDRHALRQLQRLAVGTSSDYSSLRTGSRRSKKWGSGLEFDQLREYSYGDDPRFIDWKASSRLNTIYTKEFIEDKDANCLIIIDLQDSMYFGSQKRLLSTLACYTAALLAWIWHQQGYAIASSIVHSRKIVDFPATHKEQQLRKMLDHLGRIHNSNQSEHHRSSFASHLKPKSWKKFEHIAVITSILSIDQQLMEMMAAIKRKKNYLLIGLDDPIMWKLRKLHWVSDGRQSCKGNELKNLEAVYKDITSGDSSALFQGASVKSISTTDNIVHIANQLRSR